MSHGNVPPTLPSALVAYASDDDDDDTSDADSTTAVAPKPQHQSPLPQPKATVEDAMDVDNLAPVLGPQLPPPSTHPVEKSPPAKTATPALPPLVLDTTSWVIPVIENVTDMYSYSDFVAKFMHGRRIATSETASSSRTSTPVNSNPSVAHHIPPPSAASPAPSSTSPSSLFATAAAHCPLFASFTSMPVAIASPASVSKIDPVLDKKLKQWAHLKQTQGQHFTDAVLRAPDAGNPAVLHRMIEMFGIDEYGSQFRPLHPREREFIANGNGATKDGRDALKRVKRQAETATRTQQQRQQDLAGGARSSISFVRGRTGDQPSDRW